ncbi:MAG: energy transducer TonB [Candidatus Lernaella stagnicola]|nr:energy transducer TonB [Candidatus Lernaella stagnicola]
MRKRLFIGVIVSLALNLIVFAGLLALAARGDFDLAKIIPVDFIKIEVPKPTPEPTPKPTPTPPPKKEPTPPPEPTKAPIAEDLNATEPATIQSAPVIQDTPVPVPQTVNASQLDKAPKILRFVKPQYPLLAKRAGRQGVVRLRFLVTKSGQVKNVKVLSAPKGLGFEEAAVAAVMQWKFATPMFKGKAVSAWVVQSIRFKLD